MPLYHSTRNTLQPGDIVEPGNFGRIIGELGEKHPLWEREQKLESFRKQRFSSKPSRLSATFYTDNIDTAVAYRDSRTPGDFIYEVVLVDPSANTHRACMHAIQAYPDKGWTEERVFEGYWSGTLWFTVDGYPSIVWAEYVSTSSLRVTRRV